MKKIIKGKKTAIIMVAAIVLVNVISPLKANAKEKKNFKYLALGDSIATGYGLPEYVPGTELKDSYTSLVKRRIGATDMTNLAIDGMNSTQLLAVLNSATKDTLMYEKITNAKIITITIGSNDVLQPFLRVLAKEFGGEVRDLNKIITNLLEGGETGQLELITKFTNLNNETTGLRNNIALNEGSQSFSRNFPQIIEKIKTISPNTEIYVTNIYNPYKNVKFKSPIDQTIILDLDSITQEYIDKLNSVFVVGSLNYEVIDLDNKFNKLCTDKEMKQPLVNVDMNDYNFDPHPNTMGHKVIAENVISYIKTHSTNYKLKDIEDESLKIFVNGKWLKTEVSSQIVNNRALVSIRAISEAIDAKIKCEQKTKIVTLEKDNKTINLQVGNKKAYIDGQQVMLDTSAILKNDRTLVPVRFIAESLGADVRWDNKTRTVIIKVKK